MGRKTKFELIKSHSLIDLIYIGKAGSKWRYVGRTKDDLIVIIGYGGFVSNHFDKQQTDKILEMMWRSKQSLIYTKFKHYEDKKAVVKRLRGGDRYVKVR